METVESLLLSGFIGLSCIPETLTNDGDPMYYINTSGDIYSMRSRRFLRKQLHSLGYHQTYLTFFNGGGRFYKIHRLVATSFVPNPLNLTDVNHKNGIKSDNSVLNLEWMSHRDNVLHSYRELGRKADCNHMKKAIVCSNGKEYASAVDAAKDTGCMTSNISMCCNGKVKMTKGLTFSFKLHD